MRMKKEFKDRYGYVYSFEDSPEVRDMIVERLLKFFKTHCTTGEGIHQDDNSIIDSPSVLAYIADKCFKFEIIREPEMDGDEGEC